MHWSYLEMSSPLPLQRKVLLEALPGIQRDRSGGRRTHPVGFLVAAAFLTIANCADAQVTATGTNFPLPVVSGTVNNYSIGNGAAGALTIQGGSLFTAGALAAGDLGTGNGAIIIDGVGTTVTLSPQGTTNILQPGNWGIGSVTVSGGAIVDGTNVAACAAQWCNSFVSNGAGSTGTLTITGVGSTLSLPNSTPSNPTSFVVGHDAVIENTATSSVFGTPGGASGGFLNVTSGGTLNTGDSMVGENANLGTAPAGSINVATGTETSTGTAIVNGGFWGITSPDSSGLFIGKGSNATG
jgi:hypothetical protein